MKKIYLLIIMIVLVAALIVGCSSPAAENPAVSSPVVEEGEVAGVEDLVLTVEELALYNGQDGKPAYIAVDGVIYDVSSVEYWSGGTHNGFTSGLDLTNEIKNISPHGLVKLDGLPIVGRLAE